tara:strand:+ start:128321 stop:128425 length:105 start_codon:yes stop_codon:yes gene_type:complete
MAQKIRHRLYFRLLRVLGHSAHQPWFFLMLADQP